MNDETKTKSGKIIIISNEDFQTVQFDFAHTVTICIFRVNSIVIAEFFHSIIMESSISEPQPIVSLINDKMMSESQKMSSFLGKDYTWLVSFVWFFLDTLADIACKTVPLNFAQKGDSSEDFTRRPRAYSEPWLVPDIRWNKLPPPPKREFDSQIPTLPQMLDKYASTYNKNGRIGIYSREVCWSLDWNIIC